MKSIGSKKDDKIKWFYFFYLFIDNLKVEDNLIFETWSIS